MKIRTISAIAAILAISTALTGCAGKESSVDEASSAPGSSVTSESAGTAENAVSADSSATGEAQTADTKPETAQTEQTAEADSDAEVGSAQAAEKLMSDVNGTYVPLFGMILQDKYKSVWDDACLSVLGDEEAALLNYTEGRYAYRMASGITGDCADEAAENSIKLFCTENLS